MGATVAGHLVIEHSGSDGPGMRIVRDDGDLQVLQVLNLRGVGAA